LALTPLGQIDGSVQSLGEPGRRWNGPDTVPERERADPAQLTPNRDPVPGRRRWEPHRQHRPTHPFPPRSHALNRSVGYYALRPRSGPRSAFRLNRSGARKFFDIHPDALAAIIDGASVPRRVHRQAARSRAAPAAGQRRRILLPGDADLERYRALVEVRDALDGLELKRRELEAWFKITIGTAAGLEGIASWRTQSFSRLNQDSFRTMQPDIYRLFLVEEPRGHFHLRRARRL
jgi:hypothetical protein